MFEGTEWEWGQDWLTSLAGRPLLGARPTEVADALTEAGQVALGSWTADDFVPSMLAPLLHLSPRSMATRVADTRRVVNDLPVTLAAALAGDIPPTAAATPPEGAQYQLVRCECAQALHGVP